MLAELKLALLGHHQLDNAAAAIAAADVLKGQGWQSITQDSLLTGLQQTTLPGRMQVSCSLQFARLLWSVTCCASHWMYHCD